jgi:hypothetical protein
MTTLEKGNTMNITLTRGGKPLATVTTWENFATACVEAQVWENATWPEHVENEAVALADSQGFQLFTTSFKTGLHGIERVRKYARRPQDFWAQFARDLGFVFKAS